ncbi:MAG: hypothetical protein K2X29_02875, partial [Candidatus Obscuribacterales bacterium]|nr:hypothetical protein [Candidatus Obscuribacterales bacterium]
MSDWPKNVELNPKLFGMLEPQKAVSPLEAEKIYKLGDAQQATSEASPADSLLMDAPHGAPSIAEQSRALRYDVDLIYQFVKDNIEFIPNYGLHKGGLGCLIDGSGNAFDQADLMVKLLREANYTADYVFGVIKLSAVQWSNWLNIDQTNGSLASQLLANGGIPNAFNTQTSELLLNHCWVRVNISGTNYVFDTAFKSYSYVAGENVSSLMQYDRTTFLSRANNGATTTADYVQNINETNINADLTTFSTNLITWIKTNKPAASVADIVGGRSIVPTSGTIRQTDLPYHDNSYTTLVSNVVPTNLKATFRLQYDLTSTPGVYNVDQTFFSADIYSKRLTLWFNSQLVATLRLDGTTMGNSSSAQTPGSWSNAKITVKHPYPTTFADAEQLVPILAGAQTTVGAAWGVTSNDMVAIHQQAQNQAIADGAAADSENLLGQSLLLVWDNFVGQASSGADLLTRMTTSTFVLHHVVGTIEQLAHGSGQVKLVNSFMAGFSVSSLTPNLNLVSIGFTISLLIQALESAAHQQVSGITAADSIKAIQKCNANGIKIYDAKSSNWTTGTNVRSIMSAAGYANDVLNTVESQFINANPSWRVAMPQTAAITFGSFNNFYAYLGLGPDGSSLFGQTWFGSKGSVSGNYQDPSSTNAASASNARQVDAFGLPAITTNESWRVNLTNGRFEYSSQDLTVGNQGAPYELVFARSYNSSLRLTLQGLGFGWCHNWQIRASKNSDGFVAFGSEQVTGAAAALACLYTIRDIVLSDTSMPINNLVVNCIIQEFLIAQLVDNVVRLQFGGSFLVFTKLPNGTYLQPLSVNGGVQLAFNSGSQTYSFTTNNKVVHSFRTSGEISSIVYPFGITINFTYDTGGKLTQVSNGFRVLNFTYDTFGQLLGVNDGTGRSISFTISSTTGNLVEVKNPLLKSTTYAYDQRGRLTQVFAPGNPTTAILTNIYDSLSRVKQQKDAYNSSWDFFIAGSRSEEVAPNSTKRTLYLNSKGSVLLNINALGQVVTSTYDGLERCISRTLPEGNRTETSFDANGNVLSVTQHPKPASGLSSRTVTLTYETTWNKVSSFTDAANNTVQVTYKAANESGAGNIYQVTQPTVAAGTAILTYAYNSIGQVVSRVDPGGCTTTNSYDASKNWITTVVDPTGFNLQTSIGYDAVGNATSTTDSLGRTTTATIDALRRISQITAPSPFSQQSFFGFDDNGNLASCRILASTDPLSQFNTATFSIDNKITSITPAASNQGTVPVRYEYDNLRRLYRVVDASGRVGTVSFDALDRVIAVTIDGVTDQSYTYTDNGLIKTVTDSKNHTTTYEFDGFDRLKKVTHPDSSTESWTYDIRDNVLTATTRAGTSYSFTYDALNQLLTKASSGSATVSFTYNINGKLTGVATPTVSGDPSTGTFSVFYDALGRIFKEEYPDGKTVLCSYNNAGNIQSVTYPDGSQVNHAYDQLNRLTSTTGFGAGTSFSYNLASQCTQQSFSNGISHGFGFDKVNNLSSITIGGIKPSVTLPLPTRIDFSYGFSTSTQITSKACSEGSLLWSPVLSSLTTYGAANSVDQYPSVSSVAFSYDTNGNLLSDGSRTYGYDSESKLISVTGVGPNVVLKYDPLGRLIEKTVGSVKRRYIYCGLQRIEEYDGNGTLMLRHVSSPGLDSCWYLVDAASGQPTFLHRDEAGTIILSTNSTGIPIEKTVYKPWGEVASGAAQPYGFSGQIYDADTELCYFKARYYSPRLGRFLQTDPAGFDSGLNLYAYCGNDPINYSDPLGLQAFQLNASQSAFSQFYASPFFQTV